MPEVTGTLAEQTEFLSDTPTDMNVIYLRVAVIAKAIEVIWNEQFDKVKQTPGLVLDEKQEEELIARTEPLNRELERLLEAKRRLENQSR
jgi:hypothetical protein